MAHPIIGWQSLHPVPNPHAFTDYLCARNRRLYFEDLDLTQLVRGGQTTRGWAECWEARSKFVICHFV